jgi:hypothetical protein
MTTCPECGGALSKIGCEVCEALIAGRAAGRAEAHHEDCDTRDPMIPGKPCNCYLLWRERAEKAEADLAVEREKRKQAEVDAGLEGMAARKAEAALARATDLLREVAIAASASDDPRMQYLEPQIDRKTMKAIRKFVADESAKGGAQ